MGSYIDKNGRVQTTLNLGVNNGLDNKNMQQEEVDAKLAKKEALKNPNRVAGGKKAHVTKIENKKKEFANRPLFQALNYTPEELVSLESVVSEECFDNITNKITSILSSKGVI